MRTTYTMPDVIESNTDYAANLAIFLLTNRGSIFAGWTGHMPAKDQRKLFGRFLGKGKIYIDGSDERLEHWVQVCFGLDSDCTKRLRWAEL